MPHGIYDASVNSSDRDYHDYWRICGVRFSQDLEAANEHLQEVERAKATE